MSAFKRFVATVLRSFQHKKIHAFTVIFDGEIYYICARCSGLYMGLFLSFPVVLLLQLFLPQLFSPDPILTSIIFFGLGFPTVFDWFTQRLAIRDSTNPIRFVSGIIAGFGVAYYIVSPIMFLYKVFFLLFVFAGVTIIGFIDRRRTARKEVDEKGDVWEELAPVPQI